ncbi:AAA family ATPase [Campylobacter sp.]|uniref:ATP-dependent DNA helicase n=1 Tax=Campylobacter sp. TaxID=205 RepID=UPI0025C1C9BE|nr:AAA family ATPase [Campylobacter sp.]
MVLEKLADCLNNDNVFLSGGAGVGKTYLILELVRFYRSKAKVVIVLGSTAISAYALGGITLHSFFAFKRCQNYDELYYEDRKQKDKLDKLKRILKQCDLLIIDEISMVSSWHMEMIYYRLNHFEFSGRLLLAGDFFQLPPVINKNYSQSLFQDSYYAFSSHIWQEFNFKNIRLSLPKRTDDREFYEHLFYIRIGEVSFKTIDYFKTMLIDKNKLVFYEDEYTLLCATNKKTNYINEKKLKLLDTDEVIFDARFEKIDLNLDDKTLNQWIKGLNLMFNLKVKIGAKIIFCINNKEEGYFNGEQGKIIDFIYEDNECLILIEKNNGDIIELKPYEYTFEDYVVKDNEKIEVNVKAKFIQYPIKLAYAITIHKSQGMSIDKLICDIDGIFEKGQLYVCLSRAINPKNLKIIYSEQLPFEDYFLKILKYDKSVKRFYQEQKFIDLEEEGVK